jgi:hypothetical protein
MSMVANIEENSDSWKVWRFATVAGLCCAFLAGSQAGAATGSVIFNGNISVANTCVITVINDGRFAIRPDLRQLSSKLSGGLAAVAEITSTRNFRVTAIPTPTLSAFPTGGNTGVTLTSTFSGRSIVNGRTFADRAGTRAIRMRSGLGRTRLTVHMLATRTGSAFPSGYYQGTVVIRCE